MSLSDTFKEIESIEFSINLGIASGFRPMLMTLENLEMINTLIADIEPEGGEKILKRFFVLLEESGDPAYLHPHDAALAGYLYVLSQTDIERAYSAAKKAVEVDNLWWAKKLARQVLETVSEQVKSHS